MEIKKDYRVSFEIYEKLNNNSSNDMYYYSAIKDDWVEKEFDNYFEAKRYFDSKKETNIKEGTGYSLSRKIYQYDDDEDFWYVEHLEKFDFQDYENSKTFELHILEIDDKSDENIISEILNTTFYREYAEEVAFNEYFKLSDYSISESEIIVIINRSEENAYKIVQIIKE